MHTTCRTLRSIGIVLMCSLLAFVGSARTSDEVNVGALKEMQWWSSAPDEARQREYEITSEEKTGDHAAVSGVEEDAASALQIQLCAQFFVDGPEAVVEWPCSYKVYNDCCYNARLYTQLLAKWAPYPGATHYVWASTGGSHGTTEDTQALLSTYDGTLFQFGSCKYFSCPLSCPPWPMEMCCPIPIYDLRQIINDYWVDKWFEVRALDENSQPLASGYVEYEPDTMRRLPVVLVPGLDPWAILTGPQSTPGERMLELQEILTTVAGYQSGVDMFEVPFPDNMSVQGGAEFLQAYIETTVVPIWGNTPLQFVGYSKGGLNVLAYQNLDNGNPVRDVKNLIGVGTPFKGALLADLVLSGLAYEAVAARMQGDVLRYLVLQGIRRAAEPALRDLTQKVATQNLLDWQSRPETIVTFSGKSLHLGSHEGDGVVSNDSSMLPNAENHLIHGGTHGSLIKDPHLTNYIGVLASKDYSTIGCDSGLQIASRLLSLHESSSGTATEIQLASSDIKVIQSGSTDTLFVEVFEDSISGIAFTAFYDSCDVEAYDPDQLLVFSERVVSKFVTVDSASTGIWTFIVTTSPTSPPGGELVVAGVEVVDPLWAQMEVFEPAWEESAKVEVELSCIPGDSVAVEAYVVGTDATDPVLLTVRDDGVYPDGLAEDFVFTGTIPEIAFDDTVFVSARVEGFHLGRQFTRLLASMRQ